MMNRIRIVLIVLIIINFVILICLLNMPRNMFINEKNDDIEIYAGSIEYNKKIYPANHYTYEKLFENKENFREVYSYIYKLVNNISELNSTTKNLTEKELKDVYDEKANSIKSNYLIYSFEDFEVFVNECKKIGNKKYKVVRVLTDSLNKNNNSINANFMIEYDNISLKININVDETNDTAEIKMKPLSEV